MTIQQKVEMMKAIEISRPGGPDVLTMVDRPRLAPAPTQVLISVAAAGVNRPDVLQRMGLYPPPPGASDLPPPIPFSPPGADAPPTTNHPR